MGGQYQLCIALDTGFDSAHRVPITIKVKGVYDKISPVKLADRVYNCYLKKKAYYGHNTAAGTYSSTETSCRVTFGYSGVENVGFELPHDDDKGSWTAEYALDPSSRQVTPQACGETEPADFICKAPDIPGPGACNVGTRMITPADADERTVRIPAVTNRLEGPDFKARTVAACYCPGYGSCDETRDFVQQIGVLNFYISKICEPGVGCPEDYTGVTAQYRFKVVVQCPGAVCRSQQGTRMKFIHKVPENDLPSWMWESGCRTSTHLHVSPSDSYDISVHEGVFPAVGASHPYNAPVTPGANPTDCHATMGCQQTGYGIMYGPTGAYEDQDYKEYGGSSGFKFMMGNTNFEARNFFNSYEVDICFCLDTCWEDTNWFKSGTMRLSPTRLLSSATATSNLPAQWSLEFVNQPGVIGIYRSYDDEYTMGLEANGMLIKIVEDPTGAASTIDASDNKCWKSGYDSQLIIGPSDAGAASFNYPGTTTSPETKRIMFNGGFVARTITVQKAGRIAVCYCGRVDDSGQCVGAGDLSVNWKMLAQINIKGPKMLPQQRWTFSTMVNFRFSYIGYGLTSYDKLRIIDFSGRCTDDNFNPNRAAYEYTFIRTGCLANCQAVTLNDGDNPGDLTTRVRTAACSDFDPNHGSCVRNDIVSAIVVSNTETELVFQLPHGFQDGDEITLGENFYCHPDDTVCRDETVSALKGVYQYADIDEQDFQAPSTYSTPHRVITVPGHPNRARIQIGWPEPRPQFVVIFSGTDPNRPDIIGEGGQWTHHTEGFTKEEITGLRARANMKVCWSYGRPEATGVVKYVEEVGLLTITDPAVMEGATVSISTLKLNTAAPMILQFRTATSEQIGLKYEQAEDSLRLKIIFTHPEFLDLHTTDTSAPVLPYDDFVDFTQASQQACGKLFLELWSEDMERGFPLPRGCHYRSYTGDEPRREIELIFERKSGLRKNTLYQMVFNAHIQDVLEAGTGDLLEDTFMQVIPMDDVSARPYEAIERGDVKLHPDGPIPKLDPVDAQPEFSRVSGFKIIGGYKELLLLEPGDALQFELMGGESQGNMITAGCRLRIYLFPFTQWQTTRSCTAACLEGAEASFPCDHITCEAEAVVPGMNANILKLTLGKLDPTWVGFGNLYNTEKTRIRVGAITMPPGGFFAQRLAAQVTDAGIRGNTDVLDQYPDYTISVGDLVYKLPSEGQTVAKVVSVAGGANSRPFRGDTNNILYARLMLSATLLARDDSGDDVRFRITLPAGYTCKMPDPGVVNEWEAPDDLPVFGSEVPQGRGTPDDGTLNHGWTTSGNTCTFTPAHPYGVIYQGSSMMVRIQVDNPTAALPRSSIANKWTFMQTSYGVCAGQDDCQRQGEDREYMFLSSPDVKYQSNNAVLGRILRSTIQPTNFNLKDVRDTMQDLRIFFQTEQEVSGGGEIRVKSPYGFNFGVPDCQAADLEDSYYANDGNPAMATLRLPVDRSIPFQCTTLVVTDPGDTVSYQEIRIRLRDILVAGRYYGFKVKVDNPTDAAVFAHDGWRIFTADSEGFVVDGTPSTVPFVDGDGNSWGVYTGSGFYARALVATQPGLTIGGIAILDMRPYSMSGSTVYLTLEMHQAPTGPSGLVRVVLPDTYKWDLTAEPLIFRRSVDPHIQAGYADRAPTGISAAFPPCIAADATAESCPFDQTDDSTLIFPSGVFSSIEVYGFAAPIRVPDRNPSTSSNAVFIELGYNEFAVSERVAAATVALPDVRALTNAAVGYTTNIRKKETALQFSIDTVTDIPKDGFIQIIAPMGFNFSDECYTIRVDDPLAPDPPEFTCQHRLTDLGPRIRLIVPSVTLPAGRQSFSILAENPATPYRNYLNGGNPCGTDICWHFSSWKATVGMPFEELDKSASARGYNVNEKMLEARIPPLTSTQNYATGRDDRPLQMNNIIFAFQLSTAMSLDAVMSLRGPYGFVFNEECTPGIVVKESEVFGVGNRFPDEFTVWPAGVTVESCRGSGKDARIQLRMATGASLQANRLYIIRVGNVTNPLNTPESNRWTLEIGTEFTGESSEPIEGMSLWAFMQTKITAIVTARDQTLAGEVRVMNPVRYIFRPFNTVPMDGELRSTAPDGFIFANLATRECHVELRELPYTALGVQYPGYVWPSEKLVCLVEEGDASRANVKLRDPRPVTAGLEYELILVAYNARVVSETRADWILSSFLPGSFPLDESRIPGFIVNQVMDFKYSNPDPSDRSQEVQNGAAQLPEFVLSMQFPDPIRDGDRIVIIVPEDFVFTDAAGACLNYRVECNKDELIAGADCPVILQNRPTCNAAEKTITFLVSQTTPVPQETLIMFGLGAVNPARTMDLPENFWRCTHYGPPRVVPPDRGFRWRENALEATLPIYSSKAFRSWDIIPQLENVQVDLVDGLMSAGSISGVTLSFTAVTDAEDVAIMFSSPEQFDFSDAVLDPAVPAQSLMLDTGGPLARVRTQVRAGQTTSITLRNVRLGMEGGQTLVRLTTWTGGLLIGGSWEPGTKMDERLDCAEQCSFFLPGLVDISYERLENQYHQNSDAYPVQSRWEAQMGRPAQIVFRFHVTQAVKVGQELWIYGKPYQPTLSTFALSEAPPVSTEAALFDDPDARAVSYALKDVLDQTIKVTMQQTLVPYTVYEVRISVIAPTPQQAEASGPTSWTIETWDYPYGDKPTNTNDGNTRAFPIVEEYAFRVESFLTPPITDIEVSLHVTAGLKKPTALIVVAPLQFVIERSCLVSGAGIVTDCNPSTPMPNGRMTARLDVIDTGLPLNPPPIVIRVSTPRRAPLDKAWFIEGRDKFSDAQYGWGEAEGLDIEQMSETTAMYPGIPGLYTRMVWHFKSQVLIEAGGWLHVMIPEGFDPDCTLKAIALPLTGGCNIIDPQNIIITLNSTMVPGEYAFAMGITPPALEPLRNELSLILKNKAGNVLDAAVGMPGLDIQSSLKIAELPLRWSQSKALRSSMITLGFEAVEPLPDLVVAPEQQVSEILIILPVGFVHLVGELNDFAVLNDEDMPFKEGDWLDFLQKDRLRITLDLNRSSWTTLKTGKYEFRFPVLVPSPLPAFNVWHMALCQPNYPEGCNQITDPAVLVVYPMPGFEIGEVYVGPGADDLGGTAGAAGPQTMVSSPLLWLVLLPIAAVVRAR